MQKWKEFETGENSPSARELLKIAESYERAPSDLIWHVISCLTGAKFEQLYCKSKKMDDHPGQKDIEGFAGLLEELTVCS